MVSLATLLQKLIVFVISIVDLINSLISSSLSCILLSCKLLVVTLSNSPFLSSVICLLKRSMFFLEEDKQCSSQYFLLTTSFHLWVICTFVISSFSSVHL